MEKSEETVKDWDISAMIKDMSSEDIRKMFAQCAHLNETDNWDLSNVLTWEEYIEELKATDPEGYKEIQDALHGRIKPRSLDWGKIFTAKGLSRSAAAVRKLFGGSKMTELEKQLLDALIAAQSHLEYCNYGDSWEKECAVADQLPAKIATAIRAAKGQ